LHAQAVGAAQSGRAAGEARGGETHGGEAHRAEAPDGAQQPLDVPPISSIPH